MSLALIEAVEDFPGDDDGVGLDAAALGFDPGLGAAFESDGACLFENPDSQVSRCARFAEAQIEPVQVATAAIDEAAVIGGRAKHARHCLRLDDFEVIAVAILDALFDVGADGPHMARAGCNLHPAVLQIAGDAVFRDAPLDDLVAAVANVAHELGAGRAELPLDRVLRR